MMARRTDGTCDVDTRIGGKCDSCGSETRAAQALFHETPAAQALCHGRLAAPAHAACELVGWGVAGLRDVARKRQARGHRGGRDSPEEDEEDEEARGSGELALACKGFRAVFVEGAHDWEACRGGERRKGCEEEDEVRGEWQIGAGLVRSLRLRQKQARKETEAVRLAGKGRDQEQARRLKERQAAVAPSAAAAAHEEGLRGRDEVARRSEEAEAEQQQTATAPPLATPLATPFTNLRFERPVAAELTTLKDGASSVMQAVCRPSPPGPRLRAVAAAEYLRAVFRRALARCDLACAHEATVALTAALKRARARCSWELQASAGLRIGGRSKAAVACHAYVRVRWAGLILSRMARGVCGARLTAATREGHWAQARAAAFVRGSAARRRYGKEIRRKRAMLKIESTAVLQARLRGALNHRRWTGALSGVRFCGARLLAAGVYLEPRAKCAGAVVVQAAARGSIHRTRACELTSLRDGALCVLQAVCRRRRRRQGHADRLAAWLGLEAALRRKPHADQRRHTVTAARVLQAAARRGRQGTDGRRALLQSRQVDSSRGRLAAIQQRRGARSRYARLLAAVCLQARLRGVVALSGQRRADGGRAVLQAACRRRAVRAAYGRALVVSLAQAAVRRRVVRPVAAARAAAMVLQACLRGACCRASAARQLEAMRQASGARLLTAACRRACLCAALRRHCAAQTLRAAMQARRARHAHGLLVGGMQTVAGGIRRQRARATYSKHLAAQLLLAAVRRLTAQVRWASGAMSLATLERTFRAAAARSRLQRLQRCSEAYEYLGLCLMRLVERWSVCVPPPAPPSAPPDASGPLQVVHRLRREAATGRRATAGGLLCEATG